MKYHDFTLTEKEYYIIKFVENNIPTYGVAQLTKIQNFSKENYSMLHFKHNKHEYLQRWPDRRIGQSDQYPWSNYCLCIRPHEAEFGFNYHNSRIRYNPETNQYYFPENYHPGQH